MKRNRKYQSEKARKAHKALVIGPSRDILKSHKVRNFEDVSDHRVRTGFNSSKVVFELGCFFSVSSMWPSNLEVEKP